MIGQKEDSPIGWVAAISQSKNPLNNGTFNLILVSLDRSHYLGGSRSTSGFHSIEIVLTLTNFLNFSLRGFLKLVPSP